MKYTGATARKFGKTCPLQLSQYTQEDIPHKQETVTQIRHAANSTNFL